MSLALVLPSLVRPKVFETASSNLAGLTSTTRTSSSPAARAAAPRRALRTPARPADPPLQNREPLVDDRVHVLPCDGPATSNSPPESSVPTRITARSPVTGSSATSPALDIRPPFARTVGLSMPGAAEQRSPQTVGYSRPGDARPPKTCKLTPET